MKQLNILKSKLGKTKIFKKVNLFPYLTMRQKVYAKYFFKVKKREDLQKVCSVCLKHNIPFLILGGGSNIAAKEDMYNGLVVKNEYKKIKVIKKGKTYINILISSGYAASKLIEETIEKGYSGFEYHKGLPGTVGGALYMNAKWTHPIQYFGENLIYAYIVDKSGKTKKVEKKYFNFAYDYSILQKTKEVLLEAVFKLKIKSPNILRKKAQKSLEYRKQTQLFGIATSGCFFRNISEKDKKKHNLPTTSSGYLIDKAGLKGISCGDFYVLLKHANFIVNKGNGNPDDLKKLISIVKEKVRHKFNIKLEEEVVLI